jgi:hypothetical protein
MSGLNKHQLVFDPDYLDYADTVGSHTLDGYGNLITSTSVGAAQALDVYIQGAETLGVDIESSITLDVNVVSLDPAAFPYAYQEDSAHTSGDVGSFALAVRNDTEGSLVDADGDYAPLQVDALGRLRVAADIDVVTGAEKVEDAAHSSGDVGSYVLAVRSDSMPAGSNVDTDGDYTSFFVDGYGAQYVNATGSKSDGDADDGTASEDRPVKMGLRTFETLTALNADERADAASDLYRRLYVNDSPNVEFSTLAVSVGTTAGGTQLVSSALDSRTKLWIQNTGNRTVYLGASGVSAATGFAIPGGSTMLLDAGPNLDFYAIADSGTQNVRVLQVG